VTIEVFPKKFGRGLTPIFSANTTTDSSGLASLSLGIMPDIYDITVKPSGWLRKQVSDVSLYSGDNQLLVTVNPGDINGDNRVALFDYDAFVKYYRADDKSTSCGKIIDQQPDCIVNIFDYNQFVGAFRNNPIGDGGEIKINTGNTQMPKAAVASSGKLTLSNSSQGSMMARQPSSLNVGNIVTLTLSFDTGGLQMAGVDTLIDYDHCTLELQQNGIVNSGIFTNTSTFIITDTLDYDVLKWSGTIQEGSPVSGTGYLATIPFKAIAAEQFPTNISIRFKPGSTFYSNMDQDGVTQPFLGNVTNYSLNTVGTPQRPARTAQITYPPSGGTIKDNFVFLQAQANDPCNGIRKTSFYAFYNGQWNQISVDEDGSDGWGVYWDISQIPNQVIQVKAFASDLAGNGVWTAVNSSVTLARKYAPTNVYLPLLQKGGQPPTTVTIQSTLDDGEALYLWCALGWTACRAASSGNNRWQGLQSSTVGAGYYPDVSGTYLIERTFLYFDTSSIVTG
jgi:hypothetical protein